MTIKFKELTLNDFKAIHDENLPTKIKLKYTFVNRIVVYLYNNGKDYTLDYHLRGEKFHSTNRDTIEELVSIVSDLDNLFDLNAELNKGTI
jgi:hypothetical protein